MVILLAIIIFMCVAMITICDDRSVEILKASINTDSYAEGLEKARKKAEVTRECEEDRLRMEEYIKTV